MPANFRANYWNVDYPELYREIGYEVEREEDHIEETDLWGTPPTDSAYSPPKRSPSHLDTPTSSEATDTLSLASSRGLFGLTAKTPESSENDKNTQDGGNNFVITNENPDIPLKSVEDSVQGDLYEDGLYEESARNVPIDLLTPINSVADPDMSTVIESEASKGGGNFPLTVVPILESSKD